MLSEFAIKRETFFDLKKHKIQSSKNPMFFSKELTHAFGQKCQFFLYLDLVKIRLKIMLNYFEKKKETQNKTRNNAF